MVFPLAAFCVHLVHFSDVSIPLTLIPILVLQSSTSPKPVVSCDLACPFPPSTKKQGQEIFLGIMSEQNGLPTSSASMPTTVAAPVHQEQPLLKQEDPTAAQPVSQPTPQPAPTTVTAAAPASTVAATAAAATAAVGASPVNGAASPGESLKCEWALCNQLLPNPEALYVSMTRLMVFYGFLHGRLASSMRCRGVKATFPRPLGILDMISRCRGHFSPVAWRSRYNRDAETTSAISSSVEIDD